MRIVLWLAIGFSLVARSLGAEAEVSAGGPKRLNNLVSLLVEASSISKSTGPIDFTAPRDGWIFVSAASRGSGGFKITLDKPADVAPLVTHPKAGDQIDEAVRFVTHGRHGLRVEIDGDVTIDRLTVKSIPELMHCGLGFNPAIKSYGVYDMEFLKKDILPNVTTLIVPAGIQLPKEVVDGWHAQGKRFAGACGINGQAKTADEHYQYWTGFLEKAPFLDGVIIDEFIINQPIREWLRVVTPERRKRFDEESARHPIYEEAFRKIRADERYWGKMLYAYIGGSGKKLNQEIVGPNFIRALVDCGDRIALERYLHEMSSEEKSQQALQTFVEGIADWEAKEPGVLKQMVIAFGLFSMPPGGLNKQPNVDYHVWMDRQMQVVANHPRLAGLAGLNWWTSLQADEETVRFVGKLYRHYAIEGKTELLTTDPLFLDHVQNADFDRGLEGWTLRAAEEGSIEAKSFPRYGRIEGRYMGLGRPPDPEHIGDTFLWMKRSPKGPNRFSQTIKNLTPGRLYSLKMFSCDYQDLVNPKAKKLDEAQAFLGRITLDGVELDTKRSFAEPYASSPEPPIPVWITYHWQVFRARATTATLTVSDWPQDQDPSGPFGQEQTFNFLELQPYRE